MVTSKIIDKLKSEYPNLNNNQLKLIFDLIIKNINTSLISENAVHIRRFGRFSTKNLKEKKSARNPKTGELIYIPTKKKVVFKMSKNLKEIINKK